MCELDHQVKIIPSAVLVAMQSSFHFSNSLQKEYLLGAIRLRLFKVKHPKIVKDQAGLCCGLPQPEKQQQKTKQELGRNI